MFRVTGINIIPIHRNMLLLETAFTNSCFSNLPWGQCSAKGGKAEYTFHSQEKLKRRQVLWVVSKAAFILILLTCHKETGNKAHVTEQKYFENECLKELWVWCECGLSSFFFLWCTVYVDSKFFLQIVVMRSLPWGSDRKLYQKCKRNLAVYVGPLCNMPISVPFHFSILCRSRKYLVQSLYGRGSI